MTLEEAGKEECKRRSSLSVQEAREEIKKVFTNFFSMNDEVKYYLLYSKEMNDFTIFKMPKILSVAAMNVMVNDMVEWLSYRGPLYGIGITNDRAIELWIDYQRIDNKEPHPVVYYIFNFDEGIVDWTDA